MPLIPMSSMPNGDEQLRALNMMGNYADLTPSSWLGDSGALGFYGDQTPSQLGWSLGSKKKKKDGDKSPKKLQDAMMTAQKQDTPKSSGSGATYLILGGALLAGGFLVYSLVKKKKLDGKPEEKPATKPAFRRAFKPKTKAVTIGV